MGPPKTWRPLGCGIETCSARYMLSPVLDQWWWTDHSKRTRMLTVLSTAGNSQTHTSRSLFITGKEIGVIILAQNLIRQRVQWWMALLRDRISCRTSLSPLWSWRANLKVPYPLERLRPRVWPMVRWGYTWWSKRPRRRVQVEARRTCRWYSAEQPTDTAVTKVSAIKIIYSSLTARPAGRKFDSARLSTWRDWGGSTARPSIAPVNHETYASV